jgi:hypothetical protein
MPLDALAPDQRAVVQLVLQRERSYAQIAELLSIPEDAVRARAHAGLAALAPDAELPADKLAQIADFLLGQQNGKPRQATRRLLRSSNGAREWAETVRAQLEDVGGALPALPEKAAAKRAAGATVTPDPTPPEEDEGSAALTTGSPVSDPPDAPAPRPRPLREKPRTRSAAGPALGAPSTSGAMAAASSRIGGAVLIGLAVLAIVVVVLVLFVFDGDDNGPSKSAGAAATPTASATPQPVGEIRLRGVNGSKGTGVMRLYTAQQQLAFTLEGTGVPQNRVNEAYAVWFTTPGGGSQRLGFAQPVGANGRLGTTGPRTADLDKFPRWLARYRQVVVSRERDGKAKRPGPIVLRGTLPRGSG